MRALFAVVVAGALALGVAGCGLSKDGLDRADATIPDDAAAGEPPPPDDGGGVRADDAPSAEAAAMDATENGPSPDDAGPAGPCVAAVPAGWTIVAYEGARASCPAGFGGAHDEYSGGTTTPAACPCTCQITTAPDCTTGTESTSFGVAGATCPAAGASFPVKGATCTPLPQPGSLAQNFAAEPVAFSGGACSGAAAGVSAGVTKQGVRYCDVSSANAESVCEGTAPAGFAACVVSPGDVACPAGSPFGKKTLVADDEVLACSACKTCTVTGTCASATVTFYSDPQCTQAVAELPADGGCVPSNASGKMVAAVEYAAEADASCAASGSVASVSPEGPRTLCCR